MAASRPSGGLPPQHAKEQVHRMQECHWRETVVLLRRISAHAICARLCDATCTPLCRCALLVSWHVDDLFMVLACMCAK